MNALPKIWTHKNYCRNNLRCVKCAAQHLTNECPRKFRDDDVKCVNCNEKHPSNYRGCTVHKQIQQKLYPRLKERNAATRPIQSGVTYAQEVQGQTEILPPKCNSTKSNEYNTTRE